MASRHSRHLLSSALAATLVATTGGASMAAEDSPPAWDTICDVVSVDGIDTFDGMALTRVRDEERNCLYAATSEAEDFGLALVIYGLQSLDQVRVGGEEDIMLGDWSAISAYNASDDWWSVYVEFGGSLPLVEIRLQQYPSDADTDPVDLAVAVGEIAIANLQSRHAQSLRIQLGLRELVPEPTTPSGPAASEEPSDNATLGESSLAPPDLGPDFLDIPGYEGRGEALRTERSEEDVARYVSLLDALGADFDSLGIYVADSGRPSPDRFYIATQVSGTDASALKPAFLEAFGLTDLPDGWTMSEAEVGGKSVTAFVSGDEGGPSAFVYGSGDTVYLLQMTNDEAALVLEQLP